MSTFTYSARSRDGRKVDGRVDAPDRRAALVTLERQGLVPVQVSEGASSAKPAARLKIPKKKAPSKAAESKTKSTSRKPLIDRGDPLQRTLKIRDLLSLTRDMSNLIRSGMTLGKALATLGRRDANPVEQAIVRALHQDISEGVGLSEALARHKSFPVFYQSMVRAGEASGRLPDALDQLVEYYERTLEAREKVIGAMIYPCIVLVFGFITVVLSMVLVIPRFETIFSDLGGQLPGSTQAMIALSDFTVRYGWLLLSLSVLAVVFFRRAIRTERGRRVWHGFLLRIPVLSRVLSANAFSNFARTLGGLLTNGVPVLKAMEIARDTVGNQVISEEVSAARERVTDGSTMAKPLSEGGVFPTLFTDMLAVGEEAGDTAGALGHITRRYEDDLNRNIKVFTTVLEPLLMLFVALIVGFVAMSMLMAVFSMASGLRA